VKWPETDMLHDMSTKHLAGLTEKFGELIKATQVETVIRKTEVCVLKYIY
jgi:hypothetical protein